jgi:hypothetical protein
MFGQIKGKGKGLGLNIIIRVTQLYLPARAVEL